MSIIECTDCGAFIMLATEPLEMVCSPCRHKANQGGSQKKSENLDQMNLELRECQ